jgi:transcriptional repressor NrdR
MHCPSCGAKTHTLETRSSEDGAAVRRRRECRECGHRFTSLERRVPEPFMVEKRSGAEQRFDHTKLRAALIGATHKRDVSAAEIEALVERIEAEGETKGKLTAARIGELALDGLRALDTGAFLQFAGTLETDPETISAQLAKVGRTSGEEPANRGKTRPAFRPSRRAGSGVTPKRRKRGDG